MHQCYSNYNVTTGIRVDVCESRYGDIFDNKGMYWMRLMTTLESLVTHLTPDDDQGAAAGTGETLSRLWDILKDAFFDKSLQR